jgi:hypothetical protein
VVAASTKEATTVGGNAPLTSGKETENISGIWMFESHQVLFFFAHQNKYASKPVDIGIIISHTIRPPSRISIGKFNPS